MKRRSPRQLTTEQLDRWWLIFNDPALTELEDEALRTAPDAKTAYSRLVEAGATSSSIVAGTFPTGNAGGNISKQHEVNIGPSANTLFPDRRRLHHAKRQPERFPGSWMFSDASPCSGRSPGRTSSPPSSTWKGLSPVSPPMWPATISRRRDCRSRSRTRRKPCAELRPIWHGSPRRRPIGPGALSDADRVAGDLSPALATLTDLDSQLHATRRNLLILIAQRRRDGNDRSARPCGRGAGRPGGRAGRSSATPAGRSPIGSAPEIGGGDGPD